jgi:hypothetical protein
MKCAGPTFQYQFRFLNRINFTKLTEHRCEIPMKTLEIPLFEFVHSDSQLLLCSFNTRKFFSSTLTHVFRIIFIFLFRVCLYFIRIGTEVVEAGNVVETSCPLVKHLLDSCMWILVCGYWDAFSRYCTGWGLLVRAGLPAGPHHNGAVVKLGHTWSG